MVRSKRLFGWTFSLLALGVSALGAAAPAAATTFVRVADADLAAQADAIAEVSALSMVPSADAERPRTELTVEVIEWIAGEDLQDPALPLRILLPGGVTREGLQLRFSGMPRLEPGQKALIFLRATGEAGTYRLLHLSQGLFHVSEVNGEKMLFRNFEGAHEVNLPGRKLLEPERARDFGRFTSWLRDGRSGAPRPADYWLDSAAAAAEVTNQVEKFTLISRNGVPTRYREFDTNTGVRWFSHNGGQPGLPSGGHPEFQTALRAWNNDPATPINLVYAGQSGLTGGTGTFDNFNVILFDDLSGDIGDAFDCQMGGTLAIGGPWFDPNSRHTFNGTEFITILGGDIVTAANVGCFLSLPNRAAQVFGHELGHTLGLGHSCGDDSSGPCNTSDKNDALMRASAHNDNRGARLGNDDRAAINFLYGEPLSVPAAPSGLSASPAGVGTVNLSWVDNATNETQYLVERSLNGGGFGQIGALSANARSFQDSDAPSASSASYRVRARNGAGFSDYSNVAAVQVPGAPPPRDLAVSILSATEARLTWTDVTTGETGFEVEASAFGAFVPAAVTGPDATEVTLSGLQPDTLYQFRVRAAGAPQGDSTFVTVSGRTFPGSPEACVEDATTFCLNEGRFRVQVSWRDFEDRTGPGSRVPIPATDSGVFWFFGADNWEMLVKVLDGCAITNHFWVFAAATTNVEFTLVVTDTVTGATSVHRNELGESAPAIVDTEALPVCSAGASAPPSETSQSEVSQSEVSQSEVSQPEAFEFEMPQSEVSQSETSQSEAPRVRVVSTSDPSIQLSGSAPQLDELLKMDCTESETATCLNQERFQVRGSWRDFGDNTGEARVVDLPVVSDESGLLWFFSPDNWEVLIKVLNGCPITNHYWVFAAATTNVEYRIEVTDTTTDDVVVYTNALGNVASAITDTEAFATCP